MPNNIEVVRDGLVIAGHAYSAGDVLDRAHHTHDVELAADQEKGALAGWVKRVDDTADEPTETAGGEPESEAQAGPAEGEKRGKRGL